MTEDLIVVSSLVISSTSGLASRGQKEDIALLCSQEKSHPWGVPWWGFILNIKTIYFWMCHLEERKSHNCVFWNGDQRTYSLLSPKMCYNITLLTKTELSDSSISNILLRRCKNIPNVFIGSFFRHFSMLRQNLDKLLPSSSFLHTCVQVCPRRRIRPEVSFIAIYLCEMYRCCAFVCKVCVNNANKDDHLLSKWLVWLVWLFVQVTVTPFKLSSQKENCVTRYVWAP